MEDIVKQFKTTEDFVQHQLDDGYSLNDIYNIFFQAQEQHISYEECRLQLYPKEVNPSTEVTTAVYSVYSDLTASPLLNIRSLPADTVTKLVYDEDEMKETDTIKKDINEKNGLFSEVELEESSKVLGDVYDPTLYSFRSMAALQDNPVLEKPPVYNRTSFNEAPYSIGNNNESISSLTGGLSLYNNDLTLPGRNGLSFTLTRQYNTQSAQFYDMEYGSSTFNYNYYMWGVAYNIVKKNVTTKYDVSMRETVRTEYDYNADGLTDATSNSTEQPVRFVGTYNTEAEARQIVNQIPSWTYTVPADSVYKTGSKNSPTNSFPDYIVYDQNGYYGALNKTGGVLQTGSYTPASSITKTASCSNSIPGSYTKGIWTPSGTGIDCPTDYPYSDSAGYVGNLPRVNTVTLNTCPSPTTTTNNSPCNKSFRAEYSGPATKPASDTRSYTQNYDGFPVRAAYSSPDRYESWVVTGSTRSRKIYSRYGAAWVQPKTTEDAGTTISNVAMDFETYSVAQNFRNNVYANSGMLLDTDSDANGTIIANYYLFPAANSEPFSYIAGIGTGQQYYNQTSKPLEEKLYPIGKGWSWKLPFVENKDGKTYVHLAEGGSYEVENSTLKGYEWQGVNFVSNTTVSVNGETSQYVLTSVDGTLKQYFTSDGRLIQISDAYANSIQFQYEYNSLYGTKLLSQVKDAIGNTIQIAYTASMVTLKKGTQTVVYNKHTQDGVELLDSVIDVMNRTTSYSYQIKGATFNLFSDYGERAASNPYALLSQMKLPTGATTEYTYEPNPIKRFIGATSYNEAYRLSTRRDLITYENGESKEYNRQTVYYNNSDMGSAGNQDLQFSTTLNNGLTDTTYKYKKDFIDEQTPAQYYLDSSVQIAGVLNKTLTYSYGKFVGSHTYPASVATTATQTNSANADILTTSSKYDDYGNILESMDARGRITTYMYDNRHMLKSTLTPANIGVFLYTDMIRNNQGTITQLVVRKDNASGKIVQKIDVNSLDSYGNVTSQSTLNDDKTITTITEYDNSNSAFPVLQKVDVKNADQQVSTIEVKATHDPATGQMTSFTDGNKNETDYQYDGLGRIEVVTHPDKSKLTAVYDDKNNYITITDETGAVSRIQWNALGWETDRGILVADVYKKKSSISYDSFGRKEWDQDEPGNKTQYRYDSWNRVVSTLYPDNSEATAQFNDALRSSKIVDAEGYATIQTFNQWGQLEKNEEQATLTSPVNLLDSYTYNSVNDQISESMDAKGAKTQYEYDYAANLVTVTTNDHTETTSYGYDMQGNLLSTTLPDGSVKSKTYDELGRVLTTTDQSLQLEKYTYDANGNMLTSKDRNGTTTTYVYDSSNRLKQRISADETVVFDYDSTGKRTQMTDGTGTTKYHYDPTTGLLTGVDYADGLKLQIPEYDGNGNRLRMVGPFGAETTYSYDVMNRLKTIRTNGQTLEANYDYKKNGLLQQSTARNGISSKYMYTGMDLLELDHNKLDVSFNVYKYSYDGNKNIKTRTQNGIEDTFDYDKLNRIATSTENGAETYSYDSSGNRKLMETDFSLDNMEDVQYTYDQQNHLTKVQSEGENVQYSYNGDGLLVNRTENGVTTRYYYDGDQIIAEAIVENGHPRLVANYIRGQKLEVITYQDGTKVYPLYNGHGDVVEIRDEQGAVLNKYEYDQWGNILSIEEKVHNPFRYSGELWDDTTNLQYLRARWYDPSIGRFINEDTYEGQITNPLSQNLYTYVDNNPLIYSDPSGHMKVDKLNEYLHQYASSKISTDNLVKAIIKENGGAGLNVYTSFHEISQILVATKLYYLDPNHVMPTLEYRVSSGEIDIVQGNEIYDVKPLGGSAEKQLRKYQQSDPQLTRGSWFTSINDIKLIDKEGETEPITGIIFPDLYMKIEWGAPGKIYYSQYYYKDNNKTWGREKVKNSDAFFLVFEQYFVNTGGKTSGRGGGRFSGH